MNKLKVAVVGHGFVGKAVDYGFSINVDKTIIDPIYGTTTRDLASNKPDVIFICVPTPMKANGAIDCSIIINVIEEITEMKLDSIIVIKSSVTPEILKKCNDINSESIVYNPEFLTERNANYDFINPNLLIIGGERKNAEFIHEIHLNHSKCAECPVYITDLMTASLVKYTLNTYLATKVLFMNEIYKIHNSLQTSSSWENFTEILQADGRIGSTHMKVPGPDGRFGFGGACFPKDLSALINFANEKGENLEFLNSVRAINNKIRSEYKELDQREKEQNVSFQT